MKTTITLPDDLFSAAEHAARRLGLSRSEFYQKALTKYLEIPNSAVVTAELNQVYSSIEKSRLDPILNELQRATLDREDW